MVKSICIVLSGSAAPGKEMILQSIVCKAGANNINVYGAHGFTGLLDNALHQLSDQNVLWFATQKTSCRSREMESPAVICQAIQTCRHTADIEALIIVGGKQSLQCAWDIAQNGMKCIFIPATIHNDVGYTDYCIGHDSALNAACDLVEPLDISAGTYPITCFILEVPGHPPFAASFGYWLGNMLGMPDFLAPTGDIQAEKLDCFLHTNQNTLTLKSVFIAATKQQIEEKSKMLKELEQRHSSYFFKHVEISPFLHGGKTSAYDRLMARMMGERAISLLLNNKFNLAIGVSGRKTLDYYLLDALEPAPRWQWPYMI